MSSLEKTKLALLTQIASLNDATALKQIEAIVRSVLGQDDSYPLLSEGESLALEAGNAEIEAGEVTTEEEMFATLRAGIEEGKEEVRARHGKAA